MKLIVLIIIIINDEFLNHHIDTTKPMVDIAETSGDLPPTGIPNSDEDITSIIRNKAQEAKAHVTQRQHHDPRDDQHSYEISAK